MCLPNLIAPRQDSPALVQASSWSRSSRPKLNNVHDMNGGDAAIRWMSVYLIKLWMSHLIDGPARASAGVNRRTKIHEITLNRSKSFKWTNRLVVWFDSTLELFSLSCRSLRSYRTSVPLLTWKLASFVTFPRVVSHVRRPSIFCLFTHSLRIVSLLTSIWEGGIKARQWK